MMNHCFGLRVTSTMTYRLLANLFLLTGLLLSGGCGTSSEDDALDPLFAGAVHDEELDHDLMASSHLSADKSRMWKLVRKETSQDARYLYVSPVSAINAASRVFMAVEDDLIGMTSSEVLDFLDHRESHYQGSYNFPFHPLPTEQSAMVLRFDCGYFGWQFDLFFDENEHVAAVHRRWIH